MTTTEIKDHAIWFKDINEPALLSRMRNMQPEEHILLEADNVVGRWIRMKNGSDGRPTFGIRPAGEMRQIWNNWFKQRKGEYIELRETSLADDYLSSAAEMFSEWNSAEDEEAFRDL